MSIGKTMLGRRHVLASVVSTLTELQVEGTFPTGTYLVTVHHPVCTDDGDLERALYGSFLPVPAKDLFELPAPDAYRPTQMPGAVVPVRGRITLNEGRKRRRLKITSKGDRPIQVRCVLLRDGGEESGAADLMLLTFRSARITTWSRLTHSWTLIASEPTGTA